MTFGHFLYLFKALDVFLMFGKKHSNKKIKIPACVFGWEELLIFDELYHLPDEKSCYIFFEPKQLSRFLGPYGVKLESAYQLFSKTPVLGASSFIIFLLFITIQRLDVVCIDCGRKLKRHSKRLKPHSCHRHFFRS